MKPSNIDEIHKSFTKQAKVFESKDMNFSKQEFLDYTVDSIELENEDLVLEAAAGTCACGRSIAPYVKEVVCLDTTDAMLDIGREEAKKEEIKNMKFVNGLVEDIPFQKEKFDIVLSRLAFHHFTEIEKPFLEMDRVLKKGGKLVIIDMEAAREDLREIEDRIETLRDISHVKNLSRKELIALYEDNDYEIVKEEVTKIPVSLEAWLNLTNTPKDIGEEIKKLLIEDIEKGKETGFNPYYKEEEIYFLQRWIFLLGKKSI